VRFELTDQTRQALDEYLRLAGWKSGQFLFTGRDPARGLTTRQYARLVGEWVASIGLPAQVRRHSLRRTKAVLIYRRTGNLRAVQALAARRLSPDPNDESVNTRTGRTPLARQQSLPMRTFNAQCPKASTEAASKSASV